MLDKLFELDGFAIPACEKLLMRSNFPPLRVYAGQALFRATRAPNLVLDAVRNDYASLRVENGCGLSTRSSVAEELKRYCRPHSPALNWVYPPDEQLVSAFDEYSEVKPAEELERWRPAARSIYRAWWSLSPAGQDRPAERQDWWAWRTSHQGYTVRERVTEREGLLWRSGNLTLRSSLNCSAEVFSGFGAEPVVSGNLPLVFEDRGRLYSGIATLPLWAVVRRPDGTELKLPIPWRPYRDVTVEIVDPLFCNTPATPDPIP